LYHFETIKTRLFRTGRTCTKLRELVNTKKYKTGRLFDGSQNNEQGLKNIYPF